MAPFFECQRDVLSAAIMSQYLTPLPAIQHDSGNLKRKVKS